MSRDITGSPRWDSNPRPPLYKSGALDQLSYSGGGAEVTDRRVRGRRGGGGQTRAVALGERERSILDFERSWWQSPGPKESAIRATFGLSTTRYYQILNDLLDDDLALQYDPLVVRRLRRLRDRRRRARYEGGGPMSHPVR